MSQSQPGLAPVSSLTRRDAVLNELRRAILVGELVPGERLKEVQLAQSLGVSRPTLREAIYQLIHEGLLVQETYKGVMVAQMDAASITDVAVVREALETIAAQTIAADKTGRRQELLKSAWKDYQAAARSKDPVRAHEAHLHLHRTIWLASENSMLQRIWPIIDATINLAVSTDQATRADLARAHDVHARLVEAILNNKQREIKAEVRAHIRNSADELLEIISKRSSSS